MKKIMMALGNEPLEESLKKSLGTEYNFGPVITRKGAILPLVMQENPDRLIVRESIIGELNEDMYDILFTLRTQASSVRIVLLYVLDEEEIDMAAKYIKMGIYDIWTKKKAHIEDIVNLVRHPKNFGDWADIIELDGASAGKTEHLQPKNLLEGNPIAAAGHLKIQQDKTTVDLMGQKKLPKLVTSSGYNMGRPIKPSSKDRLPERLKHPQNIKIDEEFEIIDDLGCIEEIELSKKEQAKVEPFIEPKKQSKIISSEDIAKEPEDNSQKAAKEIWKCSCGAKNEGKFCSQCGNKKPEPVSESIADRPVVPEEKSENKTRQMTDKNMVKNNLAKNLARRKVKDIAPASGLEPLQDSNKNSREKEHVGKYQPLLPQKSTDKQKSEQKDIKKRTFTIPQDISVPKPVKAMDHISAKVSLENKNKQNSVSDQMADGSNEKKEKSGKEPSMKASNNSVQKDTMPVKRNASAALEETDKMQSKGINENRETILSNTEKKHKDCSIILFTNSDRNTMGHIALNTALLLAEKGDQVVYIDDVGSSSAERLSSITSAIKLYGKYIVNDAVLKHKKAKMDNLVFIQTSPNTDFFSLVKEIKNRKEARYIVLNTDINRSVENLIILAEKAFIISRQNPVQLDYLLDNYGYQFKFCDIIIENFEEGLLGTKEIKEKTRSQRVIKIKDSDKMNYDALISQIPLLYKDKGNEELFEGLVKSIKERN